MDSNYSIPSWLTGLIIVFAIGSAATFGLFLYQHAASTAMYNNYLSLINERSNLRVATANLEKQLPEADKLIQERQQRLTEVTTAEQTFSDDTSRKVTANQATVQAIGEAADKEAKTFSRLMKDAATRRDELLQEEKHALASERDYDTRRLKLRQQIEDVSRDIEERKRQARHANAIADARIQELDDRVNQLGQQREANSRELHSEGQILVSQVPEGFVVINRGHQQNLRNGTVFVVYNRRGGKNHIKGQIEITQVDARTAVGRVLREDDANDPIIGGDYIHNPIYNPTRVKTFVIRGEFAHFSSQELKHLIEQAGGSVTPEMTTSTDYLVAGDNSDADLKQAIKLGISILSEDQLISFVRYQPPFTISKGMTVAVVGNFTKASRSAVEHFIEQSGGVVESHVSSDTQVLIGGEGASDEESKARLQGVLVFNQDQFINLTASSAEAPVK